MITQSSKKIKKRFLIILSMFIGVFASFFFPHSKDGMVNTASADNAGGGSVIDPCPDGPCCN